VDEALAPTSAISELARNITLSAYSTELAPIDEAAPVAADQPSERADRRRCRSDRDDRGGADGDDRAGADQTTVPETNAPEPMETDAPEPTETTVPEPTETNAPEPTDGRAGADGGERAGSRPRSWSRPTNPSLLSRKNRDRPARGFESADDSVPAKEPEAHGAGSGDPPGAGQDHG
jgi:hypothetical protein